MRNRKGSQEQALAAMELCVKNGFRVMSQTQVHRQNLDCLMPTAMLLNNIGVDTIRLIRTTDAPRWHENAPDSCLDIDEYYAAMLDFARQYKDSGLNMNVIVWQFLRLYPQGKYYTLAPVHSPNGTIKENEPICKGNRGMVAVTSSGEVVPCLQMSGYMQEQGLRFGNLHETPLRQILTEGAYVDAVCADLHKQLEDNPKCAACQYYRYCNGGCPALSLLYTGNMLGSDPAKCRFYQNGWYEKTVQAMGEWHNSSQITKLSTDSL